MGAPTPRSRERHRSARARRTAHRGSPRCSSGQARCTGSRRPSRGVLTPLVAGDVDGAEPTLSALRQRLARLAAEPVDRAFSVFRPFLRTARFPLTNRDMREGSSTRYPTTTRSLRASPSGEKTLGASRVMATTGGVVSMRIGFGRTIVRCCRRSFTRGRYEPFGEGAIRTSLLPSQTERATGPRGTLLRRTRCRTTLPPSFDHLDADGRRPSRSRKAIHRGGRFRAAANGRDHLRKNARPEDGARGQLELTPCRRRRAPWQRAAPRRARLAQIWPRPTDSTLDRPVATPHGGLAGAPRRPDDGRDETATRRRGDAERRPLSHRRAFPTAEACASTYEQLGEAPVEHDTPAVGIRDRDAAPVPVRVLRLDVGIAEISESSRDDLRRLLGCDVEHEQVVDARRRTRAAVFVRGELEVVVAAR